jgi:arylsulfatase A-like enzyme
MGTDAADPVRDLIRPYAWSELPALGVEERARWKERYAARSAELGIVLSRTPAAKCIGRVAPPGAGLPAPDRHVAARRLRASRPPAVRHMPSTRFVLLLLALACATPSKTPTRERARARVIVMVWDGLRPDSISRVQTPNLYSLREEGVEFTDHHSTYPTFTMVNAASLATGAPPGITGFYGNYVWEPGPDGTNASGQPVDFKHTVVFTEDYGVLRDLARNAKRLFDVQTLFGAAHAHRPPLTTAAVGKSGPAVLQDLDAQGLVVDEKVIAPAELERAVRSSTGARWPLTAERPARPPPDGVTADPDTPSSPYVAMNRVLVSAFLDQVLPRSPDLALLWLRDPDTSEHIFGPGTPAHDDALRSMDGFLGELRARLDKLGLAGSTDLIIMSDHGHQTVSAPPRAPPPSGTAPFGPGQVRLSQVLAEAGIPAHDSLRCLLSPTLSPYPVQTDAGGCKGPASSPAFPIPEPLPDGDVVVAANGGSDYLYVQGHATARVREVVRALQRRSEIAAIFVASSHGDVPGTVPLARLGLEHRPAAGLAPRHPDIIVSYAFDETARVRGVLGVEHASMGAVPYRGMHGSFGPGDVRATLVAAGPHFRKGFKDPLPTGNVDVAPTIARLLELDLPQATGRPLLEALEDGSAASEYTVDVRAVTPKAPAEIERSERPFTFTVQEKLLRRGRAEWSYFDTARR